MSRRTNSNVTASHRSTKTAVFDGGIACKSTEELIGTVGFYDWNKSVRKVEMGYDLTPRYRGRGIMTEAYSAVLRFGFSTWQLHRIQAIIDVDTHRSLH